MAKWENSILLCHDFLNFLHLWGKDSYSCLSKKPVYMWNFKKYFQLKYPLIGGGGIFFTDTLTILAVDTNHVQISPSSWAKLNRYIHKSPSDKFLFLHETLCKVHTTFTPIISSRKCYWKNTGAVTTKVTFSYICVPYFSCFVTYFETWFRTQPIFKAIHPHCVFVQSEVQYI